MAKLTKNYKRYKHLREEGEVYHYGISSGSYFNSIVTDVVQGDQPDNYWLLAHYSFLYCQQSNNK
jgi:hypothetical protein